MRAALAVNYSSATPEHYTPRVASGGLVRRAVRTSTEV